MAESKDYANNLLNPTSLRRGRRGSITSVRSRSRSRSRRGSVCGSEPQEAKQEFVYELTASQVNRLANFQSVPSGQGWNLYFSNQGNATYGIYVYQKPNDSWTLGSVGTAWRVVNIGAGQSEYGPFPLPIGFTASMIDQLPAYNDPGTPRDLVNYAPLPAIQRKVPVNSSQPLPMGTTVEYDQNFAQQANGQFVPSFSIASGNAPDGVIQVVNRDSYLPDRGMKNQRTVLQVEKNGLPLMQSDTVSYAGMPPNATYKGGLPPGFSGFLSIESKIYVGISAGRFVQGQAYSYQQLSQGIAEYELPVSNGNDILITLSSSTPPKISFRQFTPTAMTDPAAFAALLASSRLAPSADLPDPKKMAFWGAVGVFGAVTLYGVYYVYNRGFRLKKMSVVCSGINSSVGYEETVDVDEEKTPIALANFRSPVLNVDLKFEVPREAPPGGNDRRAELELLIDEALDDKDFETVATLSKERKELEFVGSKWPLVSGKIWVPKGKSTEGIELEKISLDPPQETPTNP